MRLGPQANKVFKGNRAILVPRGLPVLRVNKAKLAPRARLVPPVLERPGLRVPPGPRASRASKVSKVLLVLRVNRVFKVR